MDKKALRNKKPKPSSPLFVQSLEKGLQILRVFNRKNKTLSLSQVAEVCGTDLSTAQRFTYTFVKLGYLRKDPHTRQYELAPRSLEVANHYLRSSELMEIAVPYLLHLSKSLEETIHLMVLDGASIVHIASFPSHQVVSIDTFIGTRFPAFCTSAGLSMLSTFPEEEAKSVLNASRLEKLTINTDIVVKSILRRLTTARKNGYVMAIEEACLGEITVAAAIRGRSGVAIGALNVAVPTSRWTPKAAEKEIAPHVAAAALAASQSRADEE